jgi:hypothetical protein
MIEKLIQKSHGAGIGGVSSLVHKLVKLNPIKQTRNELKLGVVKIAQAFTTNGLRAGARNPVLRLRQGYGACTLLRAGLFLNHFKCLFHIFSYTEQINTCR